MASGGTLNRDILRLAVPALGRAGRRAALPHRRLRARRASRHRPARRPRHRRRVLQTIVGLMVFLAYSTTPAVARRFGAGDPAGAVSVGIDGMWLALGTRRRARPARYADDPLPRRALRRRRPRSRPQAETYLGISMWGLPAMLIVFAATGLLRGMQDTVTPLWIAGIGFGANAAAQRASSSTASAGASPGRPSGRCSPSGAWSAAYVVVTGRLAHRHEASVRPQREGVRGSARSGGWMFLRTVSLRLALLVDGRRRHRSSARASSPAGRSCSRSSRPPRSPSTRSRSPRRR